MILTNLTLGQWHLILNLHSEYIWRTQSTVNDLINALPLMNASYLITVPLSWQVCIKRPSLTNAPCLINAPLPWNLFRLTSKRPVMKIPWCSTRTRVLTMSYKNYQYPFLPLCMYHISLWICRRLDLPADGLDSLLKLCHLDHYNTVFRLPCYTN